jgi:hypothetical protein
MRLFPSLSCHTSRAITAKAQFGVINLGPQGGHCGTSYHCRVFFPADRACGRCGGPIFAVPDWVSPRIQTLKAILSKIRPEPTREPLPPLRHYEPPRAMAKRRRCNPSPDRRRPWAARLPPAFAWSYGAEIAAVRSSPIPPNKRNATVPR